LPSDTSTVFCYSSWFGEEDLTELTGETIFLLVTKVSDDVVQGGSTIDLSDPDAEADQGFFVYDGTQYHFNWDTGQLLGDLKGKAKKGAGVEGEYQLLFVILEDGGQRVLLDKNSDPTFRHKIPNDVDRDGDSVIDDDAGFPTSLRVNLN